ncbi:MAG: cytochrome b N-terminal domain-containing protein [Chloroflexi bacterium]|nr:cytochrome b N-terminal domain-containing protein [Chloroflexota bacterium]MCL5107488.1 cytochrome b N-terminal domain-containing protein [Chloroflexota bacterium]
MADLYDWVNDRLGIMPGLVYVVRRKIPADVNWLYTFGSATLFLFLVQALTGGLLAIYYSPSPDHAYASIQYIMNDVTYGSLVRGIHHWSASGMVLLVVAHMLRVFFTGAYKYPREMSWMVGVVLLVLTLAFGFTGYLLPWDEKAYWATVVGTNIAGAMPLVGDWTVRLLRGGADLGVLTLNRFYAMHVMLLPMAATVLISVHVAMVIRQGISYPPRRDE